MHKLHKSWQNRRSAFTKRVCWYEPVQVTESIRLTFFDVCFGEIDSYYHDEAIAQRDYDAFRLGKLSARQIQQKRLTNGKDESH